MKLFVGVPQAISFLCMLIIVQFGWRVVAIRLADTPVGKAMAFIN